MTDHTETQPAEPKFVATHRVRTGCSYYFDSPMQSRPPEGQLDADTEVMLVEDRGSYAMVKTVDDAPVAVSKDALEDLIAPDDAGFDPSLLQKK